MIKKREIKFKSKLENIHLVEQFVEEICDVYNINNSYFGNILLSLIEAVKNAIIHGNKSDASKNVTLCFESIPKGLLFEVIDEGNGFDFMQIPDPTDLNVIFDENKGNGIYLIKSLADEIVFLDKGKKTQMTFHIASINKQISSERINKLNQFNNNRKIEDKVRPQSSKNIE